MRGKMLILCLCLSLLFGCSNTTAKKNNMYSFTAGFEDKATNVVNQYYSYTDGTLSKEELTKIVEETNDFMENEKSFENDDTIISSCIEDLNRELQDDDYDTSRYAAIISDLEKILQGKEPGLSYKNSKFYNFGDFALYVPNKFKQSDVTNSYFVSNDEKENIYIMYTKTKMGEYADVIWEMTIEECEEKNIDISKNPLTYKSRLGNDWWYEKGTNKDDKRSFYVFMPVSDFFKVGYISFTNVDENEAKEIIDHVELLSNYSVNGGKK